MSTVMVPVGAGQLGHDQRGGDVPVLQAGRQPQHLVPVLGDQLEVDAPGQQQTCYRELGAHLGAAPSAVEGDLAQVADAGGQLRPAQVE
jgi:hypothetical protein